MFFESCQFSASGTQISVIDALVRYKDCTVPNARELLRRLRQRKRLLPDAIVKSRAVTSEGRALSVMFVDFADGLERILASLHLPLPSRMTSTLMSTQPDTQVRAVSVAVPGKGAIPAENKAAE